MKAKLIDFFKQQEWPDAELHVHLAGSSAEHDCSVADGGDACATVLRLPVHRILVSRSEVFKAQLLRWGKKRSRDLPEIDFTITAEEHLTGLLASLSVFYGNEDLFREVPQQDLVSAVLYGDQLAIPRAVELGMQLLKEAAAAEGAGGLSQDCCSVLACMPSWPTCMLPLLPAVAAQVNPQTAAEEQQVYQSVLAAALGDLELVWTDKQLQALLLALPLPAAGLLLSSDQLRVVSEDTVLYTALCYMEHLDSVQGRQAAKEALAKCIRCLQLSHQCLLGHATAAHSPLFDRQQQESLLGMLSLRQVPTEHCVAQMARKSWVPHVPKAWLLVSRAYLVPPAPVSRSWVVAVEEIKEACRLAASSGSRQDLEGSGSSGPLYGTAFALEVHMKARQPAGLDVGVFIKAQHFYKPNLSSHVSLEARCGSKSIRRTMTCLTSRACGWKDFFGVGAMGGDGWDEAAWAAAGLPLQGDIVLQLTVKPL